MIILNMYFIKHTNGLFHYGLDYGQALEGSVSEVWVRSDHLAEAARRRLPAVTVKVFTLVSMLKRVWQTRLRGNLIFTPSSHPLPLPAHQLVVLHDHFPFQGVAGVLKLVLFRIGVLFSGSNVGFINHSEGRRFLKRIGIGGSRARYMPNRIEEVDQDGHADFVQLGHDIVVGLFGSDSAKKNYDILFQTVRAYPASKRIKWLIYGHSNDYTDYLIDSYPSLKIDVVESDDLTLREFIDQLDIAVSVALCEGFARPIAFALLKGVPVFLVRTPVFEEFYGTSVKLFDSPVQLVQALASLREGHRLPAPYFAQAEQMRLDFASAVRELRLSA